MWLKEYDSIGKMIGLVNSDQVRQLYIHDNHDGSWSVRGCMAGEEKYKRENYPILYRTELGENKEFAEEWLCRIKAKLNGEEA